MTACKDGNVTKIVRRPSWRATLGQRLKEQASAMLRHKTNEVSLTGSRNEGTSVCLTGANRPLQSNAVGARGAGAYHHRPGEHVHVPTGIGPL